MENINSDKDRIQRIKNIIEREIEKELINKQNEVTDISERIKNVLRNLDILKYVAAVNYYDQNSTLNVKKGQEDENEDDKAQNQIHPCIKKLLPFRSNYNKSFGDLLSSHSYETRNNKKNNVSESAAGIIKKEVDSKSTEDKYISRSSVKTPQYIPPLPNTDENVGTVNSTRGSISKDCYRIIVGNISKWIPPEMREDNSTHKWMVYLRNKDSSKDVTKLLRKVRYFLHESYKPHDIIDVTSPPFHLTRRGWGEFPIRVQLHFNHPLDKPVDIIHNLKLDMTCSGAQTLGAETVVEVYLHQSNSHGIAGKEASKLDSSIKNSFKEEKVKEKQDVFDDNLLIDIKSMPSSNGVVEIKKEDNTDVAIKEEPEDNLENERLSNSKMEEVCLAISNSRKYLLDRRKIIKTIEIEHNYLKSDDDDVDKIFNKFTNSVLKLDPVNKNANVEKTFKNGAVLDSVQVNQILHRKSQERLNKFELGLNKSEEQVFKNLKSVATKLETETQSKYCMKVFRHMYLVNILQRAHATKLKNVEALLKWFVQRWPIITKLALDPTYKNVHPYSCPSEEEFFKYNIGKQRSAEWFRAKAIQKVLKSLKSIIPIEEEIWSTKQILLWSRFHGYSPVSFQKNINEEKSESADGNETGRLKSNESSSDSDEGSFDNPHKRLKGTSSIFLNGLHTTEKKKNFKKSRRKEVVEETPTKPTNYRECNTYTEASCKGRFGADDFRTLQTSNSVFDVEILEIDKEPPPKESPTKKKESVLTVITSPPGETFNKFVCETTKQIGIKVVEEEIAPGVNCDSVSRVLSQCAITFLEDLLRKSFAQAWMRNRDRCPESLEVNDILSTLIEHPQFDIFTNKGLGMSSSETSRTFKEE